MNEKTVIYIVCLVIIIAIYEIILFFVRNKNTWHRLGINFAAILLILVPTYFITGQFGSVVVMMGVIFIPAFTFLVTCSFPIKNNYRRLIGYPIIAAFVYYAPSFLLNLAVAIGCDYQGGHCVMP